MYTQAKASQARTGLRLGVTAVLLAGFAVLALAFPLARHQESAASELPPVNFHILQPGKSAVIEGIEVLPFRVPHQTHEISLGLKINHAGKQILFSGDSAWSELFVEHARGVDLFLCECSFFDQGTGNHVRFIELANALPRLECKKLMLTHLGEEMLARKKELAVAMAEDGMVIEI